VVCRGDEGTGCEAGVGARGEGEEGMERSEWQQQVTGSVRRKRGAATLVHRSAAAIRSPNGTSSGCKVP